MDVGKENRDSCSDKNVMRQSAISYHILIICQGNYIEIYLWIPLIKEKNKNESENEEKKNDESQSQEKNKNGKDKNEKDEEVEDDDDDDNK